MRSFFFLKLCFDTQNAYFKLSFDTIIWCFFIISASCCGRPDSHDVNENLSQQRAESVRQYLLANKTLSYEKIVAVGYGSKRPLASNATPKGRAVNRRIDGIIKPKPSTVGFDIRILHENWRNLPTAIYREIHY